MSSGFGQQFSERQLRQAQEGQQQAQRLLFETFYPAMMRLALAMMPDRASASDLVQEAFLKAFVRLPQVQEANRVGAWLKKLAVNLALDQLRRPELLDMQPAVPEQTDWQMATEALGQLADIEALLNILPAKDRALVWLHAVEGYSHEELANIFALTATTIRQRYRRALHKLAAEAVNRGYKDE